MLGTVKLNIDIACSPALNMVGLWAIIRGFNGLLVRVEAMIR